MKEKLENQFGLKGSTTNAKYQQLFLQKTKPLYRNPKYLFGIGIWIWIWAAKN